jgi:hypothetical protein
MCAGSGSATKKCVNICLIFTVAMRGSAPYAQQIVNKLMHWRRKFFA